MNAGDLSIGAAMSLALLSTFYGVAFGVGLTSPVSHFFILIDR
ncbi:hypothetical protein [Pajaroellobacter abortibovis]